MKKIKTHDFFEYHTYLELLSDFLVEIRIIESSKINEWKYCIQVIEDIEDTYLEITANQDKEIQEIEIEKILENYQ